MVRCGWIWGLGGALLLAGCASDRNEAFAPDTAQTGDTNAVHYPLVKPVLKLPGRVVTVNPKLRFVVLDFGFNPAPADQSVVEVIRNDHVVGELRVNGPMSGSQRVADIIRGEVGVGDEVRPR